jgi:hypothetical protein
MAEKLGGGGGSWRENYLKQIIGCYWKSSSPGISSACHQRGEDAVAANRGRDHPLVSNAAGTRHVDHRAR